MFSETFFSFSSPLVGLLLSLSLVPAGVSTSVTVFMEGYQTNYLTFSPAFHNLMFPLLISPVSSNTKVNAIAIPALSSAAVLENTRVTTPNSC